MKVLHVASGDLMAGAEAMLEQLCLRQSRRASLSVHAVLLNDDVLARRLRLAGIDVRVLDEARHGFLSLLLQLRRLVGELSPEVVHTHRYKENLLGALAAIGRRGTVCLRTVHGASEHGSQRRSLRQIAVDFLDGVTARHLQRCVVAVSPDLPDRLPVPVRRARVEVILNGIDSEPLLSAIGDSADDRADPRCRFVFLGRLVPVKRVDRLIRAMAAIEQTRPATCSMSIVGDGPLEAELKALAASLRAPVRFEGFQSDPIRQLVGASALVLASDHEGLPMAVLEALAVGVPVVAPAVGAIASLVPAEGGIVLDSADPRDLAAALLEVCDNPDRFHPELPASCTSAAMESAYHDLYLSLLGKAQTAAS